MDAKPGSRRPLAFALSMAAMAVIYFLVSDKMLTSLKFREAILPSLGPLSRVLRTGANWGIPVLVLLLLYGLGVWFLARPKL